VKLAATMATTPCQAASLAGLDYVRGYAGALPARGGGL